MTIVWGINHYSISMFSNDNCLGYNLPKCCPDFLCLVLSISYCSLALIYYDHRFIISWLSVAQVPYNNCLRYKLIHHSHDFFINSPISFDNSAVVKTAPSMRCVQLRVRGMVTYHMMSCVCAMLLLIHALTLELSLYRPPFTLEIGWTITGLVKWAIIAYNPDFLWQLS